MATTKQELIEGLIGEAKELKNGDGKLDAFRKRALMITKKVFGEKSSYIETIGKIRFSPSVVYSNMNQSLYQSSFDSGKKQVTNILNVMLEDLQLTSEMNLQSAETIEATIANKIFIVHGQNEEVKQTVARFVEKIKYEPIILHEQANKGRTIIEKFSDHSEVSFAIVLLTADDLGYKRNEDASNAKLRARQNVIFELGYFLGKLGRERVIALYQSTDNFEFPSDYQGVIYIPFDENGHWKMSILKELKAVGYSVDANLLL